MSIKAQYFKKQFESLSIDFEILDLVQDAESFTNMQPSLFPEVIHTHITDHNYDNVILMGSSFGGLLVAWYAAKYDAQNVDKLILMAPALKMSGEGIASMLELTPREWKQRGSVVVSHPRFNQVPLSYICYEDLSKHPPPDFSVTTAPVPTLIFHGEKDEVVPVEWSKEYALNRSNVNLHILASDHKLHNQQGIMWRRVREFLSI